MFEVVHFSLYKKDIAQHRVLSSFSHFRSGPIRLRQENAIKVVLTTREPKANSVHIIKPIETY